jgi:hypothetical protein
MKIGGRRCLWLLLCFLSSSGFSQVSSHTESGARAESSPALAKGVVVETIENGSASQQTGMPAGDVLLNWTRGGVSGELESPFDSSWVEIEQAPRGTVKNRELSRYREDVWPWKPGVGY